MAMLTYEEALALVLGDVSPLEPVRISLVDAAGRRVAEGISSRVNLPHFDNSQMDGYAIRAKDIESASVNSPIQLHLQTTSPAGEQQRQSLENNRAIRIFTGAPVPAGADTVVPLEDATFDPQSQIVSFIQPVDASQFVRKKGEDVLVADELLCPGQALNAGRLALLAATGNHSVLVHRQARVAILTNGDELVPVSRDSQTLGYGQIFESNSLMLSTLISQNRAEVVGIYGSADSRKELKEQFHHILNFDRPDVIVSTGGVSVGDRDFIRSVLGELGEMIFWKAAIRPGKPIVYGTIGTTRFLGLPGNPASTMVTYELFVRPLLSKLHGGEEKLAWKPTVLAKDVSHDPGRRSFVRANTQLTAFGLVSTPAYGQGSHFITSLADSNSLIVIPEDVRGISAGDQATCLLLGHFFGE
jgi:molybdopterin molybdotransferase